MQVCVCVSMLYVKSRVQLCIPMSGCAYFQLQINQNFPSTLEVNCLWSCAVFQGGYSVGQMVSLWEPWQKAYRVSLMGEFINKFSMNVSEFIMFYVIQTKIIRAVFDRDV